jgi:hypothetical protein
MWLLLEPPNPPPYLPEVTWLHPPINVDPCKLQGERGAGALVQPAKWCPEVSSCRLMMAKSSIFIPCIYLTTLTHFDWTSGVRIASYSCRFKCIRSNWIFEGGGAALFYPAKWRPEVSSCRLMTTKSSIFIPCIYLTTLTHFDWTSGVRIDGLSQRLGLNKNRLKPELTFSVLLNPLFDLEKRIVGAGLLTKTQYLRAKSGKYNAFFTCQHYGATIAIPF